MPSCILCLKKTENPSLHDKETQENCWNASVKTNKTNGGRKRSQGLGNHWVSINSGFSFWFGAGMRMQGWKSKGHTHHQVFVVCSHLHPKSALTSFYTVVQLSEFKMHKKNQDTYTAVILKDKCITLQNNGLHTWKILKENQNKTKTLADLP